MDIIPAFILNVFINSFLTFLTVVLLIEMIIFLFRIPQGRKAAYLRMIPIFKLPLDLFLYDFSKWAYFHKFNPLECEAGTRALSVMVGWPNDLASSFFLPIHSGIQLTLFNEMTFTIADIFCHAIRLECLQLLALGIVFLSFFCLISCCIKYLKSLNTIKMLSKTGSISPVEIQNAILSSYLKKHKIKHLMIHSFSGSPFVAGLMTSTIYLPKKFIQDLSSNEYAAVLGHEVEHVLHKDCLTRFVLMLIASIFWWIPLKWFLKRIEEGQEIDCDLKCFRYGIEPLDLASALCKSAKKSQINKEPTLVHLSKHLIYKRICVLSSYRYKQASLIHLIFTITAFITAFFVVFIGRYWTF